MARSSLSFTFALATVTLLLLGAAATPVSAQSPQVGGLATTPSTTPKQKEYPEVKDAITALNNNDFPGAIKSLEKAAKKNSELPPENILMFLLVRERNPALARSQLESAVHNAPNDPEAYIILGSIALQERRVTEATMLFDKAKQLLEKYSANADRKAAMEQQVLSGVAEVAEANASNSDFNTDRQLEEWKTAETRLRDLVKLAPDNLQGRQRLARALFWQGKAPDAYIVLKDAKKIDHDNAQKNKTEEVFPIPEAVMAQYYEQYEGVKADDTKHPKTWFDAALVKAPKHLLTRLIVAQWAFEKGNIAFAKEQADAAVKIEESDTAKYAGSNVGHMLRGVVALWEHRWADAEKDFEAVILQAPRDFNARNNLALALVEQKDDANKQRRALEYAQNNYADTQTNQNLKDRRGDALSTLGWVYFCRGEFDQARLALEEFIKATAGRSNNPDMATYWAHILHHSEKDWEAKELLEKILGTKRPFFMRSEAEKLLAKVKDAKKPAEPAAGTGAAPKASSP